MDEGESTGLLAESVFRWLEVVERSARSHQHQHIARISVHSILVVKAKFQTAFRAPPTSAGANKRQFLPIISKCDHIKGILLEGDIKVKLGQYYTQFRASIQEAEKLLGGIIAVLMEPAGDHASQSDTEINDLDRTDRLKRLLFRLHKRIDDAIILQKLAPGYSEWQKGNLRISWLLGLVVVPLVAALNLLTSLAARCCSRKSGSERRGPESEAHHTALTDLYTVLSRTLRCRCHFVHLGLCSAPGVLGSTYSLYITHNLSTCMVRYVSEDPPYLKASRRISNHGGYINPTSPDTASPIGDSAPGPCSSIVTLPPGSTHCLQCETLIGTEFLVESLYPRCFPSSPRSPPADTPPISPSYNPIPTLHDILMSRSQEGNITELLGEDRLRLAKKLAHWVLEYYGTPWLRGLDTQEIRFFTQHENDSSCVNWTPYISASFMRTPPERRKHNNELYALGSVLLQLGLDKLPDYSLDDNWAQIIDIASHCLPSTLGWNYTRIVKKLLTEGAKGDRMEGEQIDDLAREIRFEIDKVLGLLSK